MADVLRQPPTGDIPTSWPPAAPSTEITSSPRSARGCAAASCFGRGFKAKPRSPASVRVVPCGSVGVAGSPLRDTEGSAGLRLDKRPAPPVAPLGRPCGPATTPRSPGSRSHPPPRGGTRSTPAKPHAIRSRWGQTEARSSRPSPTPCLAASDTGSPHAGHRTRARRSDDDGDATVAQTRP
jgi:hypothetical protein